MLERTLAHDFSVASNLPRRGGAAGWRYVLPSLDVTDVRIVHVPHWDSLNDLTDVAGGQVVVVVPHDVEAVAAQRTLAAAGLADHARTCVFLPGFAEARLAAPIATPQLLSEFADERPRPLPWLARALRRNGQPRARSVGVILDAQPAGPPEYLVEAARTHGLDISSRNWAARLGGQFASQKVVFVIGSEAHPGSPELVVKLTTRPELNGRLEGEYDALRRLQSVDGIDPTPAPRPFFLERHAGLVMVAESHVRGRPFPRLFTNRDDGSALADAVGWLQQLAVATRRECDPETTAGALDVLVERFATAYRPTSSLVDFLRRQVGLIRAASTPIPAVMMHGDCGAWNLRRGADGRVLFLDWEAADPVGLPLWDVFHLFRSIAVMAPRGLIPRRRVARIRRHLVETGPVGDSFVAAVRTYGDAVGVAPELREPLFHLSWMHRALKEATRLPASNLGRGHYVRLVAMFVANRNGPVLRRAFAAD